MRHFIVLIVLLLSVAAPSGRATAESWIFGRSFHSPPTAPIAAQQPRAQGGPYYTEPQGEYTRSGLRILRSYINIQGQTVDQYMIYQSYIQRGDQF
jgi:hypothetical protein